MMAGLTGGPTLPSFALDPGSRTAYSDRPFHNVMYQEKGIWNADGVPSR